MDKNNDLDDMNYINAFGPGDAFKVLSASIRSGEAKALKKVLATNAGRKLLATESATVVKEFLGTKFGVKLADSIVGNINFMGFFAASIAAYKAGKAVVSSADRKCGTFNDTPGRNICVENEKIKGYTLQINALRKMKSKSNTVDNPREYSEKIDLEIDKLRYKINVSRKNINKIRQSVNESVMGVATTAGEIVFDVMVYTALEKSIQRSFNSIHALFSESAKKCKEETGSSHDLCISRFKLNEFKKKKEILQKSLPQCRKTKDPKKCSEKIKKKIENIDAQILREVENVNYFKRKVVVDRKKALEREMEKKYK